MKLPVFLTIVSFTIMALMILQTIRQELQLSHLKTRTVERIAESKRGDKVITLIKKQIKELNTNLTSILNRVDVLKHRKAAAVNAEQEHQKSLVACGKLKESVDKKKKEVIEANKQFKADHDKEKRKAEEEMQIVKQHILDRDNAVCIFADPSFAEARRLCGIDAPK